ncbi:MAG TPA: hypothetical protein ENG59_00355 [Chloroflexi bacterium]|nr:MAG: hypothetical protein DRI46_05925 [Chloroflexota bacterium]HDD54677.1 hypothetical protein [Chloroflexota bacterium]
MDRDVKNQLESQDPRERAQAIKTLAFSGEGKNGDILKEIHESDPDPRVREYARKAALHLYQNLKEKPDRSPQPVEKKSFKPRAGELTSVTLDRTPKKKDKGAVSRPDREKAEKLVQRAFTLYSTDQPQKAIKVFAKALEINPGLEGQTFAGNLAMELTGLSLETAFDSILGRKGQKELMESVEEQEKEKTPRPVRPLSVILLILALIALGIVASRFIL